ATGRGRYRWSASDGARVGRSSRDVWSADRPVRTTRRGARAAHGADRTSRLRHVVGAAAAGRRDGFRARATYDTLAVVRRGGDARTALRGVAAPCIVEAYARGRRNRGAFAKRRRPPRGMARGPRGAPPCGA